MLMITDEQMRTWPNDPEWAQFPEWSDVLHSHFSDFVVSEHPYDWCGVSDEASRLFSLANGLEVESGSPVDAFFSAAAAAGYDLAIRNIAVNLGISFEEVERLSGGYNKEAIRDALDKIERP